MLYEEWKSRYKNLKNFNTVLQRCPRFWPLAPPRGMNPGVYSLGISEDPPRYLSSKFDASVRSDCWDISIWKTLTQCDGNGNANADDRGDYNSSPCTSYRRAKNDHAEPTYMARVDLAKESGTFSYGALLRPMLRAQTVNGATGVFFGPREHPNLFREQGSIGWYFKKRRELT